MFTESDSEMVITWSTMDNTNESIVEYNLDVDLFQAKGIWNLIVDGGKKKHHQFIHKVCVIHLSLFFIIFFFVQLIAIQIG